MIGDKAYYKKLEHARQLRREWITALNSGSYDQASGRLVTYEGAYCCLGVACALDDRLEQQTVFSEPVFVPKNIYGDPFDAMLEDLGYDNEDDYSGDELSWETDLPEYLREEYGLSVESQAFLIALNDGGAPFEAIADAIKYLPIEIEGGYERLDEWSKPIGYDRLHDES